MLPENSVRAAVSGTQYLINKTEYELLQPMTQNFIYNPYIIVVTCGYNDGLFDIKQDILKYYTSTKTYFMVQNLYTEISQL